jgi:hypothetical protein
MQADTANKPGKPPISIAVKVNERPVTFAERKTTGLGIKQAAIQQGLPIQEDFVLFEVRGNAPLKQIGNSEQVNLRENQVFRAVAPDDNS